MTQPLTGQMLASELVSSEELMNIVCPSGCHKKGLISAALRLLFAWAHSEMLHLRSSQASQDHGQAEKESPHIQGLPSIKDCVFLILVEGHASPWQDMVC